MRYKRLFSGRYGIDSAGNVYSHVDRAGNPRDEPRLLKPDLSNAGYLRVRLLPTRKGKLQAFSVHRLVAETWVANPEGKPEVNHIDGNKLNNSAENLEWSTKSENSLHAYSLGLRGPNRSMLGKFNGDHHGSRAVNMLSLEGALIKRFPSMKEAQRQGYSQGNISMVCNGTRKSHKGFRWEYAD